MSPTSYLTAPPRYRTQYQLPGATAPSARGPLIVTLVRPGARSTLFIEGGAQVDAERAAPGTSGGAGGTKAGLLARRAWAPSSNESEATPEETASPGREAFGATGVFW